MHPTQKLALTGKTIQADLAYLILLNRYSIKELDFTLFSESIGNHLSCCSLVPYFLKMVLTRVLCTSHKTETEGSTLASSSIAMMADVNEDSAPPCSALVSIPMSWCNRTETR